MFWKNLAITADYIYTDYGDINASGTYSVSGSPLDVDIDNIRTHTALLGLAWHL